jgi:hypothetical protein
MNVIPWTARSFDQEIPVEYSPMILERLRGTPARLEERLRGLAPDILTRRDGDRWSIQENAAHLCEAEGLFLGRLDDFDAGAETLRAADMTNRGTWEGEYNARPLGEILAAFRTARKELVSRMDGSDQAALERSALHPRLKIPMRVCDSLYLQAEHDDQHLARISELIEEFSSPD